MSGVYTADDIFYLFNNLTDFDIKSWEAPVMNVSKIISGNIADGIFDCAILWISFDQFAKERFSFFENELGTLILAFLFNIMGKAVFIKNVMLEIEYDLENQFYADVFYQYGKLTQAIFLDFNLNDLQESLMPDMRVSHSSPERNASRKAPSLAK